MQLYASPCIQLFEWNLHHFHFVVLDMKITVATQIPGICEMCDPSVDQGHGSNWVMSPRHENYQQFPPNYLCSDVS